MNLIDSKHKLIVFLIISSSVLHVCCYRCDSVVFEFIGSEQAKAKTHEVYVLEIDGKPEKYMPNEKYQVTIKVSFKYDSKGYASPKFKKFLLTLESQSNPDEHIFMQTGKFQLGNDGLSKFSHRCPNAVVEIDDQPKSKVTLTWLAPPPNSGCIIIKATVIETRENWFTDDEDVLNGLLTKTICEDQEENADVIPEILDSCCACNEAKYELAFQGNWIRNNHPKDLFSTKFSDLIGASHKKDHALWSVDNKSTQGLKELAFNGSTRSLESELMDNIANLHTIIKAKGLTYPNITSTSYAIFRVDKENHLASLATKIMPSPDWIVGVSNFELCLSNCSWKTYRSVNLYPFDVGIDNALEYTESEPSEDPNPLIKPITSSDPPDNRSPFYDETGEKMKPIAKLYFRLQKIYEKICDSDSDTPSKENEPEKEQEETVKEPVTRSLNRDVKCETIGWTRWSNCSAQCGKGHMTRSVKFKHNPPSGPCEGITKEETQECEAPCESGEQEMHICSNIIWSQWTPCSVPCGIGLKMRYRIPPQSEENEDDRLCINKEIVACNDC
ncbi:hypothetical protein ABEB36_005117 [Hypothenemus hampei]|uniref:Spondin-1 n=1 Tax=Hypothenemus hampei TaxID=57062 RepID=A0ABD1EX19_HYPHA